MSRPELAPKSTAIKFLISILITHFQDYRYNGPKFLHALKSAASRFSVPSDAHARGRKILDSGTLCMLTGIRKIEANVIKSAPI